MPKKDISGIISQYGFSYQKYVYLLFSIKNIAEGKKIIFEGDDDIEYVDENSVCGGTNVNKILIQVKTGDVDRETFIKVLCNWLLNTDNKGLYGYILYCEKELKFKIDEEDFFDLFCNSVALSKKQKATSLKRRVYDKYMKNGNLDRDWLKKDAIKVISKLNCIEQSLDEVISEYLDIYERAFCSDITQSAIAKEKRGERFLCYVLEGIDKCIIEKRPFLMDFQVFHEINGRAHDEISDDRYVVDVDNFIKLNTERAKEYLSCGSRDLIQLKSVDEKVPFLLKGILSRFLYEDFRDLFYESNRIAVGNIERCAYDNFEFVLDEMFFGEIEDTPKKRYIETLKKEIEGAILPSGHRYRQGCYIYLTLGKVAEKVISWKDDE